MGKPIQIRFLNSDTNEWDKLDPKSHSQLIEMGDGRSLETVIHEKADKTMVYTRQQLYTKQEIDTLIEAIQHIDIVVSATEPTDNDVSFWFELL